MLSRPITVHSLGEARAAAEAALALSAPLILHSAPGAGAYAGIAWFERLIAAVRSEHPSLAVTAVLDCGDAADAVMSALRWLKEPGHGPITLCFTGDAATAERLSSMAAEIDVELVREMTPSLDLRGAANPLAASRDWMGAP